MSLDFVKKTLRRSFAYIAIYTFVQLIPIHSVHASSNSAKEEYVEVSYDELLDQLQKRQKQYQYPKVSAFDKAKIRAGIGLVNNFSTFNLNNTTQQRQQNGMQLSLGMDLFSRNWYAESLFKNYGITSYSNEEINLKEWDLRIGHLNYFTTNFGYTISSGISNRYFKYSHRNLNIDQNFETPFWTLSSSAFIQATSYVTFGLELNIKTALIDRTQDKSATDFAFRMDTYF